MTQNDSPPVYALTLWQPWASAIIYGPKRVENRPWAPWASIIGQRIWIHASATYDVKSHQLVVETWKATGPVPDAKVLTPAKAILGILGCARVLGWAGMESRGHLSESEAAMVRRDPWWGGPLGWYLGDVVALPEPIPCRGKQGLWRPDPEVQARCEEALRGNPGARTI